MSEARKIQHSARRFRRFMFGALAIGLLPIIGAPASYAAYPEKEITMIIPWAAGGGTDMVGRFVANLMEKDLGKPVVVVNKTGGGGLVGFRNIADAKPDGYTIGVNSTSQLLQKFSASSYVDWKTITPIAMINLDPSAFTVNADAPWTTINDALTYAKANPMKVRIANSGPGAIWHVAAAMLGNTAGVQFTHVPYKGGKPASVAVAGGHVEATSVSPAEVGTLVKGGQLRILAIASDKRDPLFPDVPTFKEKGIDFSMGVWRAVIAPKGTPKEIIARLEASVRKAVNDPTFKEFMGKNGYGQAYMGSAETTAFMARDENEMEKIIPGLGLQKK